MRKILMFGVQYDAKYDEKKLDELWDKTQDAEAVRQEYIAQTGLEPTDMNVVLQLVHEE